MLGEMRGLLFMLTYLSISCNDYLGMHGKKKASDLPLQTCWSNALLSDQQSSDAQTERWACFALSFLHILMNLICSALEAGHQRLSRHPQPRRGLQGEDNKPGHRTAAPQPRRRRELGLGSKRCVYKGRAGHLVVVIRASGQLA